MFCPTAVGLPGTKAENYEDDADIGHIVNFL